MAFAGYTDAQKEDLAASLAVLILHDSGKPVTVRELLCSNRDAEGVRLGARWPYIDALTL